MKKVKSWLQIALAVATGIVGLASIVLGLYVLGGSPAPFFIVGLASLFVCGSAISSLRSQSMLPKNREGQQPDRKD